MNKGLQNRPRGFFKQKPILRLLVALVALFSLVHLFSKYPHATLLNNTPRATVGKVMMIYGNNPVYERAVETHKEHCRRLGYPLFILRREVLDGVWNKLAYLISLIVQELEKPEDERLEWLYWIDSDTILMNPNMRLETFLPPPHITNVHILLSRDWNGMNAGVFPIRVHPWSIQLLSAAIGYPYTNPEETLTWAEQTAMVKLLAERDYFAQSAVYVPLRWFNAYMRSPDGESLNTDSNENLQVHPGDLLVHFPGTPRESFNDTLSPYLAIAEQHRSEWEVSLEKAGYAQETAKFWSKYGVEHGFELPDEPYVQEISHASRV